MSKHETEKIIGIDLGTTNSAAAVMEAGRPLVVPSAEGQTAAGKMFPSVVAFTKEGQMIVENPRLDRRPPILREQSGRSSVKWAAATTRFGSTERSTVPSRYPHSSSRRSRETLKHSSDGR